MSLLDIFKKAPKPDSYRTSESPVKYVDVMFASKATASSRPNSTTKTMVKSSSVVGINSNLPGK
jgi:hypothetical protein